MYLENQTRLSMYNTPHTTGLVLEIGEIWTHTVPFYKGGIEHFFFFIYFFFNYQERSILMQSIALNMVDGI